MTNSIFNEAFRLQRSGQHDKASRKYAAVLQHDASHYSALVNNAISLRQQRKYMAAKIHYERALSLKPDDAPIWSNYGNLMCDLHLYEEAEAAHQRAMLLSDESVENLYNASVVPFRNNNPVLAIEMLDRVLAMEPKHHNALWNRALSYLQLGDYIKGFVDYEQRCDKPELKSKVMVVPRWQGEDLNGRRILLTREQGFGDMIQFARFAQLLRGKGAHITLEAMPELMRLMRCVTGVDAVVNAGTDGADFDCYLPLMSLPYEFGVDLAGVASVANYLNLEQIKAPDLGNNGRLRVGLIWGSKPGYIMNRSCNLVDFAPLFKHPDVTFYSFQMGPASADISLHGLEGLVMDMSPKIKDFYDTAAYMKQMDLVISIDSSPVHLAGALGLETWVLLLCASDWRWLLDRTDSPWYPGARLYRQHAHNDWSVALSQLAADFSDWVSLNHSK